MKKSYLILSVVAVVAMFLSSCTITGKTIKSPNNYVEFEKEDFEFSGQVTGEATSTVILGIDWERLFSQKVGETSGSVPVFMTATGATELIAGKTKNYALYDMMEKNPGYDVVFYPQYEVEYFRPIGIPLIFQVTRVKATARLAKIK